MFTATVILLLPLLLASAFLLGRHLQRRQGLRGELSDGTSDPTWRGRNGERNALFENGVKDMLIKQGKIKIHQDVINRLISSYRTS